MGSIFSVTILTKNSCRLIEEVLNSIEWASEVIVLDTGSEDRTLDIAASFRNVKIFKQSFTGFGALHNEMARLASNDWILSLDSDEVVSEGLAKELQELIPDPRCVYAIPRRNFFHGKWIRHCGWHPEKVVRLYHRKHTGFNLKQVHEAVETEGLNVVSLKNPINHFSYASISDFLAKMQLYSELFAVQNHHRKRSSTLRAVIAKWMAFFRAYILKGGWLDGGEGYVISTYNAHTAYYKYLKLQEINEDLAANVQNASVTRAEGQEE